MLTQTNLVLLKLSTGWGNYGTHQLHAWHLMKWLMKWLKACTGVLRQNEVQLLKNILEKSKLLTVVSSVKVQKSHYLAFWSTMDCLHITWFWPWKPFGWEIKCYNSYQNTILLNGLAQFTYRVYNIVWYIIGKLSSSAFSWGVWNFDMLYIYINISILTVKNERITVKLPILISIYIISQFHIHH